MGIQILIPHNKNKEFMLSTTIPAIVSVGLNLLLLPKLGYIGASIVSVLTEVLVWLIQLFYTRSYLREVPIIGSLIKIIISSGVMYGILLFIKQFLNVSAMINVGLYAVLGAIIYVSLILIFKVIDLSKLKQQLLKNKGV